MSKIDPQILKQAIIDYRHLGKQLMKDLGLKFGLDITITEEYDQLIWRGNQNILRKGQLSQRWNYQLRGSKCNFYNKKHQQHVTVHFVNTPEFRHIDEWHLMMFLESTEQYKKAFEGVEWLDLKPVVSELYNSGEI